MIVFRCLVCSASASVLCDDDLVLGARVVITQQPPNTYQGSGAGDTDLFAIHDHLTQHVPPSPPAPFFTAKAKVSSSCLNFVLVLPSRSSTTMVSNGMRSALSVTPSNSQDFLPRTQLFSVRSFTCYPLPLCWTIVCCKWLEPKTAKWGEGGGGTICIVLVPVRVDLRLKDFVKWDSLALKRL